MFFAPDDCKRVEREGVNVIFPEDREYALETKVVPPTVMDVIEFLHKLLVSVKVTSKALSTVAPGAAVSVGVVPWVMFACRVGWVRV